MYQLDAATVLAQWSAGGLFFCWVTTRRREVGIGYGWLLRMVFVALGLTSIGLGVAFGSVPVREVFMGLSIVAALVALIVSFQRRRAGVLHQRDRATTRSARVSEMTGIDREEQHFDADAPEFPPWLDLVAPLVALPALIAAGIDAGDPAWLQVTRVVVGALFLGAVTDGMLLGHWYLTQPGLPRAPLLEIVKWLAVIWPFEVVVMSWNPGMIDVLRGTIDDGWGGTLGWFWLASAAGTIILCGVARAALKEREYSAVMAATGLLYLAIITAFSTDLVARLVLSGGGAAV